MRNFRQRAGASRTSERTDLRRRRTALQAELEAAGVRRERDVRASSFAGARQRAGVAARDESELGRLADETSTRDATMLDLRRQIESINDDLGRDRSGGLAGTGRRIVGWLRD
jgi:hypothetical protein